jgi:hypothetical protein
LRELINPQVFLLEIGSPSLFPKKEKFLTGDAVMTEV